MNLMVLSHWNPTLLPLNFSPLNSLVGLFKVLLHHSLINSNSQTCLQILNHELHSSESKSTDTLLPCRGSSQPSCCVLTLTDSGSKEKEIPTLLLKLFSPTKIAGSKTLFYFEESLSNCKHILSIKRSLYLPEQLIAVIPDLKYIPCNAFN